MSMPTVKFRMFDHTMAVEAKCPVCSWRVTTTDLDLIDTLHMDAADHELECPAQAVNSH